MILTVTSQLDYGPNSLRAAVDTLNTDPTCNMILILVNTINIDGAQILITNSCTISGSGTVPIITRTGGSDPLFRASTAITVNLNNMIITGFNQSAIRFSGGICTLDNVTITNNTNSGSGGGIILSSEDCTIKNCIISDNSSSSSGGGITCNSSILKISNSTITRNTSEFGGGINANATNLSLENCNITFNSGLNVLGISGAGGGILASDIVIINNCNISNNISGIGGGLRVDPITLTITNSTINNNIAVNSAGLFSSGDSETNIIITNSTISNNISNVGNGSGLTFNTNNSIIEINNSTIASNTIINLIGIPSPGAGIYSLFGITMNNTIVAKNLPTDASSLFINSFNNLIGDGTGSTGLTNGVNGNIVGTSTDKIDPMLEELANNGGPTLTRALQIGSPAIGAGLISAIPPEVTFDQRGNPYVRIFGNGLDIGAYELQDPICYIGTSLILTKDILTNKIELTNAKDIIPKKHQVYDTINKKFITVKLNIVTGTVTEFYKIKKGIFGKDTPSEDFYVTGGHKLVIKGSVIKARDIRKAIRVQLEPQYVYSICTKYQCPILINNLNVLTWDYKKFYATYKLKN